VRLPNLLSCRTEGLEVFGRVLRHYRPSSIGRGPSSQGGQRLDARGVTISTRASALNSLQSNRDPDPHRCSWERFAPRQSFALMSVEGVPGPILSKARAANASTRRSVLFGQHDRDDALCDRPVCRIRAGVVNFATTRLTRRRFRRRLFANHAGNPPRAAHVKLP
jgi:hypothetical protein